MVTKKHYFALVIATMIVSACNSDSKRVIGKSNSGSPAVSGEKPVVASPDLPSVDPEDTPNLPTPDSGDVVGQPGDVITGPDGTVYIPAELENERGGLSVSLDEYNRHRGVVESSLASLFSTPNSLILKSNPSSDVQVETREGLRNLAINWQIHLETMNLEVAEVEQRIAEINYYLGGDAYDAIFWTNETDEIKGKIAVLEALRIFIDDTSKRSVGEKTIVALEDTLDDIKNSDHPTPEQIIALENDRTQLLGDIAALEDRLDLEEKSFDSLFDDLSTKPGLSAKEQETFNKLVVWKNLSAQLVDRKSELATEKSNLAAKSAEKNTYDKSITSLEGEIAYRLNAISVGEDLKSVKVSQVTDLFAIANPTASQLQEIDKLDDEIRNLDQLITYQQQRLATNNAELLSKNANRPDYETQVAAIQTIIDGLSSEVSVLESSKQAAADEVNDLLDNLETQYKDELEDKKIELLDLEDLIVLKTAELADYEDLVALYEFMINQYVDMFGNN